MADTQAIRHKMREKGFTVQQVSDALGVNQSTFHRKLCREGGTFTLHQAEIIAKTLNLSAREAQDIFFSSVKTADAHGA